MPDAAVALLYLAVLLGETIADEQQWRFQCEKKAKKARGEPIEIPFLTTGLFKYSRHPNFFFEQTSWWVLYALGSLPAGKSSTSPFWGRSL